MDLILGSIPKLNFLFTEIDPFTVIFKPRDLSLKVIFEWWRVILLVPWPWSEIGINPYLANNSSRDQSLTGIGGSQVTLKAYEASENVQKLFSCRPKSAKMSKLIRAPCWGDQGIVPVTPLEDLSLIPSQILVKWSKCWNQLGELPSPLLWLLELWPRPELVPAETYSHRAILPSTLSSMQFLFFGAILFDMYIKHNDIISWPCKTHRICPAATLA